MVGDRQVMVSSADREGVHGYGPVSRYLLSLHVPYLPYLLTYHILSVRSTVC